MNFFKKRDDSRSRRSARAWAQRCKQLGLLAIFLLLAGSAGFAQYHRDAIKTTAQQVAANTLAVTADAGFRVKDILVTGRSRISAEEFLDRLSIKENMPIFGVNITEAQKSLADIPWVKDVSISRLLPDKIIVELQERTPVALWQYQKKISVIDQEGTVLTANNLDAYQHLPLLVGEDARKNTAELLALLNAEPAIAEALISAVRIGGRRWDLNLKGGLTVKLPEQDVELALRRLAMAKEQKNILGRHISSVDLRLPEKMLVTPVTSDYNIPGKNNKKTNI